VLRRAYVRSVAALRYAAYNSGVLARLQRSSIENRTALWVRSLFAIYDIKDMAALDLPWWNLAAVAEIDAFLKGRQSPIVFEYGSGASTIWLARRAASVISIEHDPAWHAVVSKELAHYDNATLRLIEADREPVEEYVSGKKGWQGQSFQRYASSIDGESSQFDLIVIDGRARAACLAHAVKRLASGGQILFDNSNRQRYRAAIKASDLSARTFRGLTACLPYPDETTLLGANRTFGAI
jgi:predicted O-methyltransferase YrrM